jgi:peptidoglycan/xylan/chitin deacetylase (PgdA/CDA1 family)
MNKKILLANLLFGKLNLIIMPIANAIRPKVFYLLAYHRVFPLPADDYPFSKEIISVCPEEFQRQMGFVAQNYDVINFNILSNLISSDTPLPKYPLIITFDDGYFDNHDFAFNILRKFNLTATVFLTTSNIDSGEPFWYDEMYYILQNTSKSIITFDSGKHVIPIDATNRSNAIESISNLFGTVSNNDRQRLYHQLKEQADVEMTLSHKELVKPLNWHQIKEMSKYGIEFGSHTANHPYLANTTDDEIMHELATSKESIQKNLGLEIKSVAYPFGSYSDKVMECVRKSDYEFGIAYKHDIWRFDKSNKYGIPRIHVETDVNFNLFQANLLLPQVFVKYGS